jgi:hypothetical protein
LTAHGRAISIKYLKTLKSLIGVELMRTRVTLTLLFGIIQSLLAFSAMILACILYFNVFDVQSLWNISQETINFHLAILLTFGVFLIASGLLLINEWREIH